MSESVCKLPKIPLVFCMLFMKQKLTINNRVWRFYKDLILRYYIITFGRKVFLNQKSVETVENLHFLSENKL